MPRSINMMMTTLAAALLSGRGHASPAESACNPCHACARPTSEAPCLRTCARSAPAAVATETHAPMPPPAPPDQVTLGELAAIYEPVLFDHRRHADMAEFSTGCAACHHHTPEGQAHPACRSCHPQASGREDIPMPGLKGAYHRQCLSCHREWSQENACSACHQPRRRPDAPHGVASNLRTAFEAPPPSAPSLTQPESCVYQTALAPKPVVTFHHGDHAQTFGLRCVECHQGQSCGQCHHGRTGKAHRLAESAVHSGMPLKNACFACHRESNCDFCHQQSPRPRFDHVAAAGWTLEPHHAGVPCADCHGSARDFTVPQPVCHACHVRPHSQSAGDGLALAAGGPESGDVECLSCHTEMRARFDHAASVHGPAADRAGCAGCHDSAVALSPRPECGGQRELCLKCHDRPVNSGRGRPVSDIAALLAANPNHHGPVREGDCAACHDPHASNHARLLVAPFTPDFYAPFTLERYELCFRCHDQAMVLSDTGIDVTGFRDGDRNLHRLHVNQSKGRTCRVCHEVHASSRAFHIRESVPFADSNWTLPINYAQSAAGGGCAPGCHAPESYDRDRGVIPTGSASTERLRTCPPQHLSR